MFRQHMYESDVKADVNTTVLRSVCTDVLQQHLTCMGSWPRQSRGRSFAASVLLFEVMQQGLYLTSQARDAGHTDLVLKVG